MNCNLAAFEHYDGYAVMPKMKVGDLLYMVREDENKYDHKAIALFYVPKKEMPQGVDAFSIQVQGKEVKAVHIGYIPAVSNSELAMMFDFGHSDIFECRISTLNPEGLPN